MEVAIPANGWAMSFAECYLDETQTDGECPVFAIAGALFTKDAAIAVDAPWRGMLAKWGLPFFHMAECNAHKGTFAHLTKNDCDLAAREAITIACDAVSAFVYVTVEIGVLDAERRVLQHLGGPYEWCAISIPPSIANWCAKNPQIEAVHFFFEDGALGQANARYRVSELLSVNEFRSECRFAGMTWIDKKSSAAIQIADMAAWHCGKDAKRSFAGQSRRRDFDALIEGIPAYGGHWSAAMIRAIEAGALWRLYT